MSDNDYLNYLDKLTTSTTPPLDRPMIRVTGSDYVYDGWLVAIFPKRRGAIRYVVEDVNGRLFIHNAKQLGVEEGWGA